MPNSIRFLQMLLHQLLEASRTSPNETMSTKRGYLPYQVKMYTSSINCGIILVLGSVNLQFPTKVSL